MTAKVQASCSDSTLHGKLGWPLLESHNFRAHLQEAALEKAQAGEGRNVEHVALEDDATLALASAQQPKRRKRKQAPEVEQVQRYPLLCM